MSRLGPLALAAYGVAAEAAAPLLAARAWWRGGSARAALALGLPPGGAASYLLWVHGASVGETLSALPLVRALLARDAGAAALVTAGTPAALERLRLEGLDPARVVVQPRPVDSASAVRRFVRHWRPDALVLVEQELWPGMLLEARAARVPVALVNGRVSERSARRWLSLPPLRAALRELLAGVRLTLAQTPQMAARLRSLGARLVLHAGDPAAPGRRAAVRSDARRVARRAGG